MALRAAIRRHPILSQMVAAGTIAAAGDATCQLAVEKRPIAEYDFQRTGRFFILAFGWISPILCRWFGVLERVSGGPARLLPLKRVIIDQIAFAPAFNATIIYNLRLLEGFSFAESWDKLRMDYVDIITAAFKFWPLVQTFNFYVVPLHFRVIFIQFAALMWNTFLSFKTQSRLPIPPME